MEWIFTLPYSEFEVLNVLQKRLLKRDGYAFYVPTSRQQKWIDFIIHNAKTNKILRVQVKSSRSFIDEPARKPSSKEIFRYNLWFNNFLDRYENDNADYYLLFWLYPVYDQKKNITSKKPFWKSLILCFSEKEMNAHLQRVKTKKEWKADRFFWFWFDSWNKIFGTRWLAWYEDMSLYLIDHKIDEIKKTMETV